MGVDEQPRSFAGLQRGCGISQVYAAAFDRLRGELQPAASPAWSSFSEPLQIDGLRRRQLFHRAGARHPLKSVESEIGKGLRQLERYPYCGHGTILGTQSNAWQDRDSVLAQFSQREAEAKEAYQRYIAEGVVLGMRPELVGGSGSAEWFAVKSQRRRRIEESTDERILGSGAFVERVLKEADARTVRQNASKKTKRYAERVVAAACKKDGISLTELRSGSRRGKLPAVRVKIVQGLVEDYGVPIAEIARQVGISTSGVSKILTRSLSR
jgi:putative transposase